MIKLTQKKIREIYQELDCGMKCFYNPEKDEIVSLPNFDNNPYAEKEMWLDTIAEIKKNHKKYIGFNQMPPEKSFEIMEDFTETIGNKWLRKNLSGVFNEKNPFRNFKFLIDNSAEYRQKWFDYKEKKYCKWIESQLKK
jgi:hypothetical protein